MNDENLTLPGEAVDPNFGWTYFYEAMANGLLEFRYRRRELLAKFCIYKFDGNLAKMNLEDICPFSVMARFNRNGREENRTKRDENRTTSAKNLAHSLEMSQLSKYAPKNFGYVGIPILPSMNALFFDPKEESKGDDIDTMWELFAYALDLASGMEDKREAFIRSYDKALEVDGVGVSKLTMGLYWIRPRFFLSLDGSSRGYIKDKLGIPIKLDSQGKDGLNGKSYLALRDELEARFRKKNFPVHSFPELAR